MDLLRQNWRHMSKVAPQELTQDDNFDQLMAYLGDPACHDDDLPDIIYDLYPTACFHCVQFAYDDMIQFRNDPLPVAKQLHEYLTCDDPHDPNECGSAKSLFALL